MTSKKVYFGLLGLIGVLALGAIGSLVLGNSMLRSNANNLVELKLENRVLEEQQIALLQANKDVEKYSELESLTRTIVPQDKDQAKSVRELVKIAAENNINITSITFPTSTLGTTPPKTTKSTEKAEDTTNEPKATTPQVSQVTPVDGISGVYQMEITIQSDSAQPVSYNNLVDFLEALENNRRTAQVANISIQPRPDDPKLLTFSIIIKVFIKP